MAQLELGPVGAALSPGQGGFVDAAVELEDMGYSTIWITGGPLDDLGQVVAVVRGTQRVRVATGIVSVDRFGSDAVSALYSDLEATHPGRFVVGLGGAHGQKPVATLNAYLDALDALDSDGRALVPVKARVLAALGPRMLELARERAAGALPVLVTPEYTADARSVLGEAPALAIELLVVLEPDPTRARELARGPLGVLGRAPSYQANFRRMGFTGEEIGSLADRLVDALVAWGDVSAVAARISDHIRAGADHVVLNPVTGSDAPPVDEWRQLARAVIR
jgi:probable F420-dependent oxidoreductase